MNKIYLYPIWLRLWHWFNALLFLILILSGISLHYSDSGTLLVPFETAIIAHNVSGIILSAIFLFYTIMNIKSRNYKHYIPILRGFIGRMFKQARYYLIGIFLNEPHPYHANEKQKFNPMQQVAYFSIIFFGMPIIIISGILLMFPELAPDEIIGMGGVWPMALLHTVTGFFLSVFMIAHIYLATTGNTPGELFKSMLNGWHLSDDSHHATDAEVAIEDSGILLNQRKRLSGSIFNNGFSMIGAVLTLLSLLSIVFMLIIRFFTDSNNPYSGIVTYVLFPTFIILGIFLIIFGLIRENRRALSKNEKKLPVIDFNIPRHQIKAIIGSVAVIMFLVLTVYGSFNAYEYTETTEFCGETCHEVMEPEYTTYLNSPHSRVECVKCHIGGESGWFVKSKSEGAYQVYSVLFNRYSKPLKTPINHLRPSQETCEQCHWPEKFYNETNKNYSFFLSDEKNSEMTLSMTIKVGGGNQDLGLQDGIHWHMSVANDITYYAADENRMIIPYIRVISKVTGKETVYKSMDTDFKVDDIKMDKLRKFDCMDCHNRPSHIFRQPQQVINSLMANGKIDKTLPFIKKLGVQALENTVGDKKNSLSDIRNYIYDYYNGNYPDLVVNKKNEIDAAVWELNNIFQKNYFPKMKVNWKTYPDHLSHIYSPGCFRCHDGKHVSQEGKVLTNDCNTCHVITKQTSPFNDNHFVNGKMQFNCPGGLDNLSRTRICSDCHGK